MSVYALAIAAVALALSAAAEEKKVEYPKLNAALHELQAARTELKESKIQDKEKKEEALKAINSAIISIKLIVTANGGKVRDIDRKPDFYKKHKDHPHVRAAMIDLSGAREELKSAKSDFQGNRKRALMDIDRAANRIKALLAEPK